MMPNVRGHGWPVILGARLAHTRFTALACLLGVALVSPGITTASDPIREDPRQVISNQSVSIDNAGLADRETPPEDLGDSAPAARADLPADGGGGYEYEPVVIDRSTRRKSSRQDTPLLSNSDSSISWYRTGYGALAIVLTLALAATWAIRRWVPAARAGDHGVLRVVGRTSLTTKHSVALVAVGRRFVVVGISGDRLTSLSEVDDPEEVAELAARVGRPQGRDPKSGFDEQLLAEWQDYRKAVASEEPDQVPPPKARGSQAGGLRDLLRRLQSARAR